MKENVICREQELYQALLSCMESGLKLYIDGRRQTPDAVAECSLLREPESWEGKCLKNDRGEVEEIHFFRR